MKKLLAILVLMLLLMLTACGQEPAKQEETQPETTVETQPESTVPADGIYSRTETFYDGTVVTFYHKDSMDGPMLRVEYQYTDGSYREERYSDKGTIAVEIEDNPNTGKYTVTEYYDNGNQKSFNQTKKDSDEFWMYECYEDGTTKYLHRLTSDGLEVEEKVGEKGYTTYLRYKQGQNEEEYIADEDGKLLQYVRNGATYDPAGYQQAFDSMKTKPAATTEDSNEEKLEDGTVLTTTTYDDGKVVEVRTNSKGKVISQNTIQANGDRSYREYYNNGKRKVEIDTCAENTVEFRYDEDGYCVYYHQYAWYVDIEITTDETGKVAKIMSDGKELTEPEEWMRSLNFRSW